MGTQAFNPKRTHLIYSKQRLTLVIPYHWHHFNSTITARLRAGCRCCAHEGDFLGYLGAKKPGKTRAFDGHVLGLRACARPRDRVIHGFFVVSLIALVAAYWLTNSLWLLMLASGLMFFACGFISPMSMGQGLVLFRPIAGTASAVMFLISILTTSVTSFLAGYLHVHSILPLLTVYAVLLSLMVLVYWRLLRGYRAA